MKIEFNKAQYRELIKLVMLGAWVKAAVLDARGLPHQEVHAIEDHLLSQVENFELDEMAEEDADGTIGPSEKLAIEIERMIEEYDEDTFWFELETELGQRDFYQSLKQGERAAFDRSESLLPPRVHAFYEKYAKEFEKHGTDRLRIVTESPDV